MNDIEQFDKTTHTVAQDMFKKGATHPKADDSRTGGRCYRADSPAFSLLPITVMTSHINLLSVDHSEMASNETRFASGIFAIFAKALICANINMDSKYSHKRVRIGNLRAWSGLLRLHRPFNQKTGLECNLF